MTRDKDPEKDDNPFDLKRFMDAQESMYDAAISELISGKKRSHWMWYIFPQIDGLGHSPMAKKYAIKTEEEARAYLKHPVLGSRLEECAEVALDIEGRSVTNIFGYPDDMKFRSCMTLFGVITGPDSVFNSNLKKYFRGNKDTATIQTLEKLTGK